MQLALSNQYIRIIEFADKISTYNCAFSSQSMHQLISIFFDKLALFFDKLALFFDKLVLFFDKLVLFFDKFALSANQTEKTTPIGRSFSNFQKLFQHHSTIVSIGLRRTPRHSMMPRVLSGALELGPHYGERGEVKFSSPPHCEN